MELDDNAHKKVVDLIFAGRKIEAIKVYRELSSDGLKFVGP